MKVDPERLAALFSDPALAWILDRLRRRLAGGQELTGSIRLPEASPEERRAFDRLLGRRPSRRRGRALTLRLGELEALLCRAELAETLRDAVETLVGPVENRRAARERREERWATLIEELAGQNLRPEVRDWLAERRTRTLVRRYAARDPDAERRLLEAALEVAACLPASALPLAELAASALGDSHALDAGQPLGTLLLPLAARFGADREEEAVDGGGRWDAAARRDAWASAGVLLDELSAPVLVLNLPARGETVTARALRLHAAAGEPYRLSTRQLLRDPPGFPPGLTVYVCENPAVLASAAHRLGPASAPLVSVEGQPTTAARLLLDRLASMGARLLYHGDFDWGGMTIARGILSRHGAEPWRLGAADYRRAVGADGRGGTELVGRPTKTPWDPDLERTLRELGRAVHEEQLLDELLADLAPGAC